MIRAVRRMLPECRQDPGLESLVWQSESFAGRHCDAAAFDPAAAEALRAGLTREDPEDRRRVYDLVADMRRETYPGVWYAELIGLEHEVAAGLIDRAELDRARAWFHHWDEELARRPEHRDLASDQPTWFRRACAMVPAGAYHGASAGVLHAIWRRVHAPGEPVPDHLDLRRLPPPEGGEVRTFALSQAGNRLVARPFPSADPPTGSILALIRTRNGIDQDRARGRVLGGRVRPEWAVDWGHDPFGAWAAFEVGGVRQKMRWIPPGRFLMGSPEDEEGRFENEGPQHEVVIDRGFWMFDTPVHAGALGRGDGRESEPLRRAEAAGRAGELGRGPGFHGPAVGAGPGLAAVAPSGAALGVCVPGRREISPLRREPRGDCLVLRE